jgi:hypothetical protein
MSDSACEKEKMLRTKRRGKRKRKLSREDLECREFFLEQLWRVNIGTARVRNQLVEAAGKVSDPGKRGVLFVSSQQQNENSQKEKKKVTHCCVTRLDSLEDVVFFTWMHLSISLNTA